MWRKVVSSDLQTLAPWRRLSSGGLHSRSAAVSGQFTARFLTSASSSSHAAASKTPPPFPSDSVRKKRIEDFMPIATGHEREELEAELQGKNILDINFPEGPFGTKMTEALNVLGESIIRERK